VQRFEAGTSHVEQQKKALPDRAFEERQVLHCERLFPEASAWTSDASTLIVAWARGVAIRSGCDIIEIGLIRGEVVELRIEEVVFQSVVPGVCQGRLP